MIKTPQQRAVYIDNLFQAELVKRFGKRAGNARYERQSPGSRAEWLSLCKLNADRIMRGEQ